MTMPTPSGKTTVLPPPGYPMLVLLITDNIVDDGTSPNIRWIVGKPHPFVPGMHVVRMFVVDRGGVEIYSVSDDGNTGMRDLVPMQRVRLAEEAMPLDIFAEELYAAENDGDDEDLEEEPAEPGAPSPNGQA